MGKVSLWSGHSTTPWNENGFRLICKQRNKHESGFVTEIVNNRPVKHVIPSTRGLKAPRTGSYIRRILNSRTEVQRDSREFRDNRGIPGAN